MKIHVTGRTGFVPRLALKRLAEAGHEVHYLAEHAYPHHLSVACPRHTQSGGNSTGLVHPNLLFQPGSVLQYDWLIDGTLAFVFQAGGRTAIPLQVALRQMSNDHCGV